MVGLGDLPGGSFFSGAGAVSADGSTIVGASASGASGGGVEAFVWQPGTGMTGLGFLPQFGVSSQAVDVSGDGTRVVGSTENVQGCCESWTEAFLWTSSTGIVGLGDLAGGTRDSSAQDISLDGTFVVGSGVSSLGQEAVVWSASTGMIALGDLSGGNVSALAEGVSADGSIIVGAGTSSNTVVEAFIWDAMHGMRELDQVLVQDFGLDLTGWTLSDATAISDDGLTIVGYGANPSGHGEAWIAFLPEPKAAPLLLAALVLVGWRVSHLGEGAA
jgi:probable HAF family extracellular repeat protein